MLQIIVYGLFFVGCAWLTVAWFNCYRHTRNIRAQINMAVWSFMGLFGIVVTIFSSKISNLLIIFAMVWLMILVALLNKESIPGYRTSRDFILLRKPTDETIDASQGLHVPYNPPDVSIRNNKMFIFGLFLIMFITFGILLTFDK